MKCCASPTDDSVMNKSNKSPSYCSHVSLAIVTDGWFRYQAAGGRGLQGISLLPGCGIHLGWRGSARNWRKQSAPQGLKEDLHLICLSLIFDWYLNLPLYIAIKLVMYENKLQVYVLYSLIHYSLKLAIGAWRKWVRKIVWLDTLLV